MLTKKMKRALALVMAASLLVLSLTACGGSGKKDPAASDNTKESSTGSKGENSTQEEKPIDLGGYEFKIVSPFILGIVKGEGSPESPFLDAFDKRQKEIEKKYNCKIIGVNGYPDMAYLQPLIMAGDKVGDVMDMMPEMWVPASQAGYLTPWDDVKGIDVNAAKWVKSYTDMATFRGKHWGINYNRPAEVRGCMFFNKTLLQKMNQPDPYELVKKGEWTFEKFREIAKACTKDTNNDGKIDIFGMNYLEKTTAIHYFVAANGGRMWKEENGKILTNFSTKNVEEALQFAYDLYQTDKVVDFIPKDTAESSMKDYPFDYSLTRFMEGNIAFLIGDSWMQWNMKAMKDDFGIIPVPKGPKSDDYVSLANNMRMFAVPSTNKDLDKTALIWNAITEPLEGFEGEQWWQDDLRDEAFRDDQSVENYNLLLQKSIVDYGYTVVEMRMGFNDAVIQQSIYHNKITPAAALDIIKGMYQEQFDALFNKK